MGCFCACIRCGLECSDLGERRRDLGALRRERSQHVPCKAYHAPRLAGTEVGVGLARGTERAEAHSGVDARIEPARRPLEVRGGEIAAGSGGSDGEGWLREVKDVARAACSD